MERFCLVIVTLCLLAAPDSSASVLKDYRSLSKNFTSLLDTLLDKSKYDRRIRPDYGGAPLIVTVNMVIKSMGEVSEAGEHYTMDCYFRQVWRDRRLTFTLPGLEEFSLPWLFLDRVWKPDTFFMNGKRSHLHRITVPNKFLRLREDGVLTYSMRLTIKASCPMHFRKFPLDAQKCPLLIGSYGYGESDMVYRWPDTARVVTGDVELAQYDLTNISTQHGLRVMLGQVRHSMIKAVFHMKRHTGYFILQVYVPCGLIVSCSWVSFWIDPSAVPARIQLGVTSVLSLTTMGMGARAQMPPVSYATALDWYIILCFLTVFSVVGEFALIHYRERVATSIRKALQERADKEEDKLLDKIAPTVSAAPQIQVEAPEGTEPPQVLVKGKPAQPPDVDFKVAKAETKPKLGAESVLDELPEVPLAAPAEDTALVTHITEQVQLWRPAGRNSRPPGDIVEGKLCIQVAPTSKKDADALGSAQVPTTQDETMFKDVTTSLGKTPSERNNFDSKDFLKNKHHYDTVDEPLDARPATSAGVGRPYAAVRKLGCTTAPYGSVADIAGPKLDFAEKPASGASTGTEEGVPSYSPKPLPFGPNVKIERAESERPTANAKSKPTMLPIWKPTYLESKAEKQPTAASSTADIGKATPSPTAASKPPPWKSEKPPIASSIIADTRKTASSVTKPLLEPKIKTLVPSAVLPTDSSKIAERVDAGDDVLQQEVGGSVSSPAGSMAKSYNEKLTQNVREAIAGGREEDTDVEAGLVEEESPVSDGLRYRRRREVLLTGEDDDELEWQDELEAMDWGRGGRLAEVGGRLCDLCERLVDAVVCGAKRCRLLPNEQDVAREMRQGKEKFSRIDTAARTVCPFSFLFLVFLYYTLYTYYITDEFPVKTHRISASIPSSRARA
ncbi:uncharacterized protein LOC126475090 [Schistocerca serialis cubense]|uniref:uncharacterized protein LOC126475090 n=1 Tax=Schistocerca serialis cubense TaxID=2023355 RepID=UPI00214DFCD1|nr:uncharacterized protein LOC126475090 [Schistocerca serialis cubense]